MKNQQKAFYQQNHPSGLFYRNIFVASSLVIILVLALASCSSGTPSGGPTGNGPTATPTEGAMPTSQTTPTKTGRYSVKVYFSKSPESENDFKVVYPVERISPTSGVATFALQQLIAGPTAAEKQAGYYSELGTALTGPSSCADGSDFTLTLDRKGNVIEQGTATVKFCRTLTSKGIGMDARIHSEINSTLLQFATIKKVVILTSEGHCFGDESGMDVCLK